MTEEDQSTPSEQVKVSAEDIKAVAGELQEKQIIIGEDGKVSIRDILTHGFHLPGQALTRAEKGMVSVQDITIARKHEENYKNEYKQNTGKDVPDFGTIFRLTGGKFEASIQDNHGNQLEVDTNTSVSRIVCNDGTRIEATDIGIPQIAETMLLQRRVEGKNGLMVAEGDNVTINRFSIRRPFEDFDILDFSQPTNRELGDQSPLQEVCAVPPAGIPSSPKNKLSGPFR